MSGNRKRDLHARISFIMFFAILLVATGYVQASDVFSDNFENGTVSGWQVVNGTFIAQSSIVKSGAYAADLKAGNDSFAYHSIPNVGGTVVMAFDVQSDNAGAKGPPQNKLNNFGILKTYSIWSFAAQLYNSILHGICLA
jgi:hypothetical protein